MLKTLIGLNRLKKGGGGKNDASQQQQQQQQQQKDAQTFVHKCKQLTANSCDALL